MERLPMKPFPPTTRILCRVGSMELSLSFGFPSMRAQPTVTVAFQGFFFLFPFHFLISVPRDQKKGTACSNFGKDSFLSHSGGNFSYCYIYNEYIQITTRSYEVYKGMRATDVTIMTPNKPRREKERERERKGVNIREDGEPAWDHAMKHGDLCPRQKRGGPASMLERRSKKNTEGGSAQTNSQATVKRL